MYPNYCMYAKIFKAFIFPSADSGAAENLDQAARAHICKDTRYCQDNKTSSHFLIIWSFGQKKCSLYVFTHTNQPDTSLNKPEYMARLTSETLRATDGVIVPVSESAWLHGQAKHTHTEL